MFLGSVAKILLAVRMVVNCSFDFFFVVLAIKFFHSVAV